jgi:hypothetical protein
MHQRQGDLIIERVSAVPVKAVSVASVSGRFILAEGEATGHAHTITATPDVELFERNGVLYCRVAADVAVEHQEHAAHTLMPGVYRIRRQIVEDAEHAPRQVAD